MEFDNDHCIKMNDGNKIPAVGFGTYSPDAVQKSKCEEATKVAIEVGFRHIDGAFVYGTEEEVGRAIHEKIADGTVKREDIFYTGKLGSTFHRPELVRNCLEQSLKKLKFDYLDLFIIHIPVSLKPGPDLSPMDENGKLIFDVVDLRQTWEAMEACKDAGLVKSIGVSNFNRRQLEMILNKPGLKYKPVLNQVECHPYLNQSKLLAFCKSKDILLEAYCALGSQRDKMWIDQSTPVLLEDPVLGAIAKKYNRSPALVALRYQLQRGIVVLFKSFTRKRIEENFQAINTTRLLNPTTKTRLKHYSPQETRTQDLWTTLSFHLKMNNGKDAFSVPGFISHVRNQTHISSPCSIPVISPREVPCSGSPASAGDIKKSTLYI
ncbi:aldo-keto reductase family 1 member C3 homolog isoform X2 [Terrapene carolina triunguis]|uniref:aldo-keto reductase family 1 member C3 homolog isoform X2 n=1 Tax=Terrapene triunguis TaxID=2587831 RepID=UPI000E77F597|nr:aldo-keto reductase family 1 member C3 homolog isoform X2 [Terrapene carolina triunguis]